MSETSAEYRAGFATLLPNHWWSDAIAYYPTFNVPCPDIRFEGREALAWRAVMALRAMERVLFTCHLINGMTPVDALYATIEGIGRHHDRRT